MSCKVRKKKKLRKNVIDTYLLKWKQNSYEVLKQEISKNVTTEFVISQNEESTTYSAIQTPFSSLS